MVCVLTGGGCDRAAAAWLAERYGLSPEDATKEAMQTAEECSIVRLGDPCKLAAWLGK